jgi:uncharacterized protein with FMN-binding domain
MRKATLVIVTIAILGALGLYGRKNDTSSTPPSVGQTTNTPSTASTPVLSQTTSSYQDGQYTGATTQTPYGNVQVAVIISGGKITNVNFLQMPSDENHSQEVTSYSAPILKQETLSAQSPNIDFVSGATSTSSGYQRSLQAALDKAAGGTAINTPALPAKV